MIVNLNGLAQLKQIMHRDIKLPLLGGGGQEVEVSFGNNGLQNRLSHNFLRA